MPPRKNLKKKLEKLAKDNQATIDEVMKLIARYFDITEKQLQLARDRFEYEKTIDRGIGLGGWMKAAQAPTPPPQTFTTGDSAQHPDIGFKPDGDYLPPTDFTPPSP